MADKTQKYPDNVPGKWYVDSSCVICGLCSEYAGGVFATSGEGDHNFVHRQPLTAEEEAEAMRAKEGCPTDAIGNDDW